MEKTIETAHGKFLLRPYQLEDEQRVLDLWEIAFKNKAPDEVWRWKFHNNPFGRQIMLCLTEENIPVAMYSGIPFQANWQGKDVRFTQLIDNMSHPDYRFNVKGRKGLYALTVDHFVETYGWPNESVISYGFPGVKHFKLGKLFFEYQLMGGGGVYLKVNPLNIKSKKRFSFRKTEIIQQAGSFFDELQQNLSLHYPFAARRDSSFVQWRLFENPAHKYFVFAGKSRQGDPLSYLVLSLNVNTATIVDIFVDPDKKEAGRLIVSALNQLNMRHLQNIQIWLPANHFLTKELVESGFEIHPEPIGFIPAIRIYNHELDYQYTNKKIFYTMADADLF